MGQNKGYRYQNPDFENQHANKKSSKLISQGSKNRLNPMDLDVFDPRNRILRPNMAPEAKNRPT